MKRKTYSEEVNFVTLTVINWIDVFTRRIYNDILIQNLDYCRKRKGLEIFAFVIMTNHLHLIIKSDQCLPAILRDFKTYTSKELVKSITSNPNESRREWMIESFKKAGAINNLNKNHQFWQNGNYPIALFSNKVILQKLDYIHENPVRAGFVDDPSKYYYSSANPNNPLGVKLN
ncbi:transposase [Balneolaceae bacterium YR4-1]|uniref:Transposase n=1 Tax=Halalkalibaculum roseum TaxID=2709311 RepID=A0A6M1SR82_9BACT|nr:transposase [Halalkalibaculum roseum]NGP75242.1 transposase [Halalkalibaculum roseum]